MGHQRLGQIPKSRSFAKVVALVTGTGFGDATTSGVSVIEEVEEIAAATLSATRKGLNAVSQDAGLIDTFYLLTQLVLAARDESNWRERFADIGITLSDNDGMFEFSSALQNVIQDRNDERSTYSDVSEMSRKAAVDAIKSLAGPRALSLFGTGPDELHNAVHTLSTKKGFSELGRKYFSGVLKQFLNFYLCKITPNAVREGRIDGIEGLQKFDAALDRHCFESARIVQDFCGDWYSKTEWREGIDPQNTKRAVAFAIEKLQKELKKQEVDG